MQCPFSDARRVAAKSADREARRCPYAARSPSGGQFSHSEDVYTEDSCPLPPLRAPLISDTLWSVLRQAAQSGHRPCFDGVWDKVCASYVAAATSTRAVAAHPSPTGAQSSGACPFASQTPSAGARAPHGEDFDESQAMADCRAHLLHKAAAAEEMGVLRMVSKHADDQARRLALSTAAATVLNASIAYTPCVLAMLCDAVGPMPRYCCGLLLHRAACDGNVDALHALFTHALTLDGSRYSLPETPMHNMDNLLASAAQSGDLATVRYVTDEVLACAPRQDLAFQLERVMMDTHERWFLACSPPVLDFLLQRPASRTADLQGVVEVCLSAGRVDLARYFNEPRAAVRARILPLVLTSRVAIAAAASSNSVDVMRYLCEECSYPQLAYGAYMASETDRVPWRMALEAALTAACSNNALEVARYLCRHAPSRSGGALGLVESVHRASDCISFLRRAQGRLPHRRSQEAEKAVSASTEPEAAVSVNVEEQADGGEDGTAMLVDVLQHGVRAMRRSPLLLLCGLLDSGRGVATSRPPAQATTSHDAAVVSHATTKRARHTDP